MGLKQSDEKYTYNWKSPTILRYSVETKRCIPQACKAKYACVFHQYVVDVNRRPKWFGKHWSKLKYVIPSSSCSRYFWVNLTLKLTFVPGKRRARTFTFRKELPLSRFNLWSFDNRIQATMRITIRRKLSYLFSSYLVGVTIICYNNPSMIRTNCNA